MSNQTLDRNINAIDEQFKYTVGRFGRQIEELAHLIQREGGDVIQDNETGSDIEKLRSLNLSLNNVSSSTLIDQINTVAETEFDIEEILKGLQKKDLAKNPKLERAIKDIELTTEDINSVLMNYYTISNAVLVNMEKDPELMERINEIEAEQIAENEQDINSLFGNLDSNPDLYDEEVSSLAAKGVNIDFGDSSTLPDSVQKAKEGLDISSSAVVGSFETNHLDEHSNTSFHNKGDVKQRGDNGIVLEGDGTGDFYDNHHDGTINSDEAYRGKSVSEAALNAGKVHFTHDKNTNTDALIVEMNGKAVPYVIADRENLTIEYMTVLKGPDGKETNVYYKQKVSKHEFDMKAAKMFENATNYLNNNQKETEKAHELDRVATTSVAEKDR